MDLLVSSSSLRLVDAGRESRRTLADAIEVFRCQPRFTEEMRAQIRIGHLRLPWGKKTGLVQVICEEQGLAVSLPSCTRFYGTRTLGSCRQRFKISRLDGAIVDSECNVRLSDGTHLHNVEVLPTAIRIQDSHRERRIVALTIQFIGADDQCYRPLHEKALPDLKFLDYRTLPDLKLPPLRAIVGHIVTVDPTFSDRSRQTIANALRRSGMRLPRSRRRRRPRL